MVTDSLAGHSMLFTHLYFMLGEKNRSLVFISSKHRLFWCWIHSFSVCQQILKENLSTAHWYLRWTAKYVFFISEAMKIAVSFSKFQRLYAMLLRWDNSKHGFSVCLKAWKLKSILSKGIFIKVLIKIFRLFANRLH